MTEWYDISSPRTSCVMASKVKAPMVEKKKATARLAKKVVLEGGNDLGDDRQQDIDDAKVLSDAGMSDYIVPEDCEGGPEASAGSRSGSSMTSISHADLERIIEDGQTKIGMWLLSQQDTMWEKRVKNIEPANS